MAVSKIVLGTTVLVDLTADTVAADKLLQGYTAHGADGESITGALSPSGGSAQVAVGSITLDSVSQTISISGLGFTPARVMLIMSAGSGTTNNRVRSAYSEGNTLHCQRYYASGLLSSSLTSNYQTGSCSFGNGTISLGTGDATYAFMNGTYTYVAWAE